MYLRRRSRPGHDGYIVATHLVGHNPELRPEVALGPAVERKRTGAACDWLPMDTKVATRQEAYNSRNEKKKTPIPGSRVQRPADAPLSEAALVGDEQTDRCRLERGLHV